MMSELRAGEVVAVRPDKTSVAMSIGGGFMDVAHDRVVILADSAKLIEAAAE
jgi:F0F1-type ATP synthase epsilon subunit